MTISEFFQIIEIQVRITCTALDTQTGNESAFHGFNRCISTWLPLLDRPTARPHLHKCGPELLTTCTVDDEIHCAINYNHHVTDVSEHLSPSVDSRDKF